MSMSQAHWRRNGRWFHGTLEESISLDGNVISLVGGGGKTTVMYHLAEYAQRLGKRTGVITTTKIFRPPVVCRTPEDCQVRWEAGQYAVCGQDAPDGKLRAPTAQMLDYLLCEAEVLLVEADGAKGLPCKAPAEHEPVILPQTSVVLGVMGLDALGRSIEENCFRPEQVSALLQRDRSHLLTPEDMAKLLLSPQGTRKHVGGRNYHIILNKCDNETRLSAGKAVVQKLEQLGHVQTVLTCFQEKGHLV